MSLNYRKPLKVIFALIVLGSTAASAAETYPMDTGTTAWMLTSTAFVLLMVPGLAMFYGGLVRTKNVLGTMMHSFAAMAIIDILWVVCGYAMCFGATHGWVGWDSNFFLLSRCYRASQYSNNQHASNSHSLITLHFLTLPVKKTTTTLKLDVTSRILAA